jgi:hypothetical protein
MVEISKEATMQKQPKVMLSFQAEVDLVGSIDAYCIEQCIPITRSQFIRFCVKRILSEHEAVKAKLMPRRAEVRERAAAE